MGNDMIMICIECGKEICLGQKPNTCLDMVPGVELKKQSLACGLERTYYACPHCGMEYTIMLTDEEIRDLMAQREKFRGYGKIKNQGLREQKRREYLNLDKKIKEKLDLLNQR